MYIHMVLLLSLVLLPQFQSSSGADLWTPLRRTRRGRKVKLHVYDVSRDPNIQRVNFVLANKDAPVKLGKVVYKIPGNELGGQA